MLYLEDVLKKGLKAINGHHMVLFSLFGHTNTRRHGQIKKQGPTRHRPIAHPVVLRYCSYSTTLAEHTVHGLQRCLAFVRAGTCLFLSVNMKWLPSHVLTGWRDDHGPTNVRAMVKTVNTVKMTLRGH